MTTDPASGDRCRPLGAFERTIDLYMARNPVQFSLVVELTAVVAGDDLVRALAALQRRHPLLSSAIDRHGPRPAFVPSDRPVPVVAAPPGTPWQSVVAREQQRPIDSATGPLLRATSTQHATGTVVVLTFAHQIVDGVGALQVVSDLVSELAGDPMGGAERLPPALEELPEVARPREALVDPEPTTRPDDPMAVPGSLTPFAGTRPHVSAHALDAELTATLRRRCRAEGVTVHAALCAAVTTVLHGTGRDHVRVLSPIDLRRALGLPAEVAVRFAGARTGTAAGEAPDFWTMARDTHAALLTQRRPAALRAGAQALGTSPPSSPEQAESMMAAVNAADVQITNLGVAPPSDLVTAIWGPAQLTQMRDEHVLGVVTANGRLRMTELTHRPVAGLIAETASVIADACG